MPPASRMMEVRPSSPDMIILGMAVKHMAANPTTVTNNNEKDKSASECAINCRYRNRSYLLPIGGADGQVQDDDSEDQLEDSCN